MVVDIEDSIIQRLFFKKFGRALPEPEKKKDDVDINFVIDLTDGPDDMEVATSEAAPVAVVKTEPIEVAEALEINANANVSNVTDKAEACKERKEVAKARKALIAFRKMLRKSKVILEKEAPLAASTLEIVADSNVSEDNSVNPVKSAEEINAEAEAEIEANQKEFVAEFGDIPLDEFDNTGFRLYGPDDVEVTDKEEAMIDDI